MQATAPERPEGAPDEGSLRELNARITDGLLVQMLWCAADDAVFVRVSDQRTGEGFSIPVQQGQSPLEVFNHPYAYKPISS